LVKSNVDKRVPEVKDCIRMFQIEASHFTEYEEDGHHVVSCRGFFIADVKGYIPPAMMNMASANNFYKYFKGM